MCSHPDSRLFTVFNKLLYGLKHEVEVTMADFLIGFCSRKLANLLS